VDPVEERTILERKEVERNATASETITIWIIALALVCATIGFSLFYSSK
jgi:hypothetical protein